MLKEYEYKVIKSGKIIAEYIENRPLTKKEMKEICERWGEDGLRVDIFKFVFEYSKKAKKNIA